MSTIKCLIYIFLIEKIYSILYLSIDVNKVDDCVSKIYLNENPNIEYFKFEKSSCSYNNFKIYPNRGKPIVANIVYTLGKTINIEIYNIIDKCWIDITIKINEYIIKSSSNNKFLKCSNCKYNFDEQVYQFDNIIGYENLTFKLDNFSNLLKEDDYIKLNNRFYSLTSKRDFEKSIYYKNDELELINFNTTNNFYIQNNESLYVNYTNYKYLMEH